MSFLGSLYAAVATKRYKKHAAASAESMRFWRRVADVGPHEFGLYMVKNVSGRAVVYHLSKAAAARRRTTKVRGLTGVRALDQLFMAAAPALAPESRPFKPVRKAKAARVKLLTTAKMPLGSRHFERVAEIGPYVPGFYVVKNVDGRAVVYRRSAVEMRRYPAHLGYPCP